MKFSQSPYAHDSKTYAPAHNAYQGTPKEKLAILMGEEGIAKLENSTVMVLGCGGVGSNCIEALARAGVGSFILFDHDVVAASNINRQAIAFLSTIGQDKVLACRDMIRDINPKARVSCHKAFVSTDNLNEVFAEPCNFVVDALDTISTKLALALYAQEHKLPYISSMGMANKTNPCCLEFADIYDTKHDSLCRVMRKAGRKCGLKSLDVLYSAELGCKISTDGSEEARRARNHLGTMSYMPPIAGQMIASFVVRKLLEWPVS